MQAYSMDLRVRVMADVDSGMKIKDAAIKYRVSTDWIGKLKRLRRETGTISAKQQRVSTATKLDESLPQLEQLVKERPDATLKELRDQLGLTVGVSTIWRALKRLQYTFKKSLIRCRATACRCAGTTSRLASSSWSATCRAIGLYR